jgi:hypothetical protein
LIDSLVDLRSPLNPIQLLRRLTPLLAAPAALLINPGRADAVLTYNIFQSGLNVVVQASGSLNLPASSPGVTISDPGIFTSFNNLSTGPASSGNPTYRISGPATIPGFPTVLVSASSFSGITTTLTAGAPFGIFGIDPSYASGTPDIISSATFNSTTLANLGFTATGPIGTWSILDFFEVISPDQTVFDTINVVVGPPVGPPALAAVPGPLPLFGAAAAFGWSRKLRRRLAGATPTIAG